MQFLLTFAWMFFSWTCEGALITSIGVEGGDEARVNFELDSHLGELPSIDVSGNVVSLSVRAKLSDNYQGKIDLDSPHSLIQRLSAYSIDGSVKVKLVMKGEESNLRDRISLREEGSKLVLAIRYPLSGENSLLSFQNENKKIESVLSPKTPLNRNKIWLFGSLVVLITMLAMLGGLRVLKKRGGFRGSRKFLIEQLSYFPLGTKSGVSLLKIGSEFVLVGITPQQISFLSSLPTLEKEYLSQTKLEREVFKEALHQEVKSGRESLNKNRFLTLDT